MIKLYLPQGDYEYLTDVYFWSLWISEYVTDKFKIENTYQDFAILRFEYEEDELMFKLKSPKYIKYDLIAGLITKDKIKNDDNL